MTSEAFDSAVWSSKRDELANVLRADAAEGVSLWLDTFAEAMVDRNIAACDFLVEESIPLPDDINAVVQRYLRPGVAAWRGGRNKEITKLLSAGVARAEPTIGEAIAEPPEPEDEERKQAAGYALKAAWLEAAGRTREAAEANFEAGKRYSWQGEAWLPAAIDLLSRAIELDERLVPAYWQLAEALRVRSFTPHPPYAAREPLERSLAAWNAGAAQQLPDAATSWPYVTRALICEQQARLDVDGQIGLWWEAVCYLERAILLDDSDAGRWAALGRVHRLLENERCALDVTAEAIKRDPLDPSALEERAAILADSGRFEEALLVLEQRLAQDLDNAWTRGVKAYVLANRKDYRAALDLIEQVIASEPDSIWNLDLRAFCCWMLGERARALATYEQIGVVQSKTPTLTADDQRACAYAAYKLGKVDAAISLLENLSSDFLARGDVRRTLGLCHFVKRNVLRAEELLLSGLARAQIHELNAFIATDLADLEARSQEWRSIPGAVAAFNRVKKTAAALAAGLSPSAAEDVRGLSAGELTTVLQVLPDDDPSAMKLGAQAGLARLKLGQQRWTEAAEAYRDLQRAGRRMPEAGVGIDLSLQGLLAEARAKVGAGDLAPAIASFRQLLELHTRLARQDQLSMVHEEIGDTLWRAGDSEALEHFQHALALAPSGESEIRLGRLHARAALALQHRGDTAGADKHYVLALQRLREAKVPEPGEALSRDCRPLMRNVEHFWTVDATWGRLGADSTVPDLLRRDFHVARASGLTYLDDAFGLSKHADVSLAIPVITPVSLEVGNGMIPLVDPKVDSGKFIQVDIPAMRNGIESSTGVRMPGISVRGGASGDRYTILLDEVPSGSGAVYVGSRFSLASPDELAAAGVSGDGVIASTDPVSGRSGHWWPAAHAEALIKHGDSVLSETQFVLAHVDLVLRRHLDAFLGVQELQSLLIEQRKKGPVTPALTTALSDGNARVAFSRILRALAREQVPITEWPQILETAQGFEARNLEEAVTRVRMTLRDKLPGNEEAVEYVEVPAEWQNRIVRDRLLFNASPIEAHGLLVEIRRLLETRTGPVALVTSTALLRAFVRRLIEFEFATVAVLWRDEVLQKP